MKPPRSAPPAGVDHTLLPHRPRTGCVFDFADRLEAATRAYVSGFRIVRDKQDIAWGAPWDPAVDELIDRSWVFIPIMTPLYFERFECRRELTRFADRQKKLGRTDLILPVRFIEFEDEEYSPATDTRDPEVMSPLTSWNFLRSPDYSDWTAHRLSPDSRKARGELDAWARHIRDRVRSLRSPARSGRQGSNATMEPRLLSPERQELPERRWMAVQPRRLEDPPVVVLIPERRGWFASVWHTATSGGFSRASL
jgi:TIR domain